MEIDAKQLREFLLDLYDNLYRVNAELVAYQVARTLLATAGLSQELDQLLEQTRRNPSPALIARYQAVRETIERLLLEEKPDAALEFLKNWKPEGPLQ